MGVLNISGAKNIKKDKKIPKTAAAPPGLLLSVTTASEYTLHNCVIVLQIDLHDYLTGK